MPVTEKYTPAQPYVVQAVAGDASTNATVAAADTGLGRFLTGDDPPALRAAHLLAGLAVVADEQPSISRGITLVNPDDWDPDPLFTRAMIAGLQGNPLLQATTVTELLDQVPVTATDGADGAALLARRRRRRPAHAGRAPPRGAAVDPRAVPTRPGPTSPRCRTSWASATPVRDRR